jgi:hypothetical protein
VTSGREDLGRILDAELRPQALHDEHVHARGDAEDEARDGRPLRIAQHRPEALEVRAEAGLLDLVLALVLLQEALAIVEVVHDVEDDGRRNQRAQEEVAEKRSFTDSLPIRRSAILATAGQA